MCDVDSKCEVLSSSAVVKKSPWIGHGVRYLERKGDIL